MIFEPKPLRFAEDSLTGISQKTIENHYGKLYKGYVAKYNEVSEKLLQADKASANQTYSEWRGLKQGETFALDAIILHELYFDNLGGNGSCEGLEIEHVLVDQFGSFDAFKSVLMATGMGARGWVVVALNPLDDKLHIYACDAHNQGGIWGAVPILILDVYEHAYFIDFGADRKSYLKAFWENLDWKVINQRFMKLSKKKDGF